MSLAETRQGVLKMGRATYQGQDRWLVEWRGAEWDVAGTIVTPRNDRARRYEIWDRYFKENGFERKFNK